MSTSRNIGLIQQPPNLHLYKRNPTEEREVPIPSQDRLAAYRERWYQDPLELEKMTAQ